MIEISPQPPSDLNKVINDSRNEIHDELEKKIAKKRGRPAKDSSQKSQSAKPIDMNVNSPMTQKMSVDGYKSMLTGVLNLAGIYLNKASDTKCFTLEKEELELITQQGAECMMEFVPSVESKYMKLAGFAIVVTSVYGMRYAQFTEINEARLKEKKVKEVNAEVQSN